MKPSRDEVLSSVGLLVGNARDKAMRSIEASLTGQLQSARDLHLAEAVDGNVHALVEIGHAAIDDCLVAILAGLEESERVLLTVSGTSVADVSDGLAGELFGDDGWIALYSSYGSTV